MRTRMGLLFMNLSVTDILILLVCMPSAAVDLYAKEIWYFGEVLCKLVPFLENAVTLASVLTILAITIDRYYGICSPTLDNEWKRFKVAQKIIGIWTLACLSSAPMFFIVEYKDAEYYDGSNVKVCRQPINSQWKIGYIMTIFFVFFFVILLILLFLISRMAMFLLHQTNLFEGQNKERQINTLRSRRKVVVMLLLVVICFFVCLLPQRIVGIWFVFAEQEDILRLGLEGYLNLLTAIRMLMYLNSALNPVIYNSMSTKVRRVMTSFLNKRIRNRHKHLRYDSSNRYSNTTAAQSPSLSTRQGVHEPIHMMKIQYSQRKYTNAK
ncbi:hypothetical protein FSP39_025352 [Pinctada imbricata]|uniref:G-protein coupled receptors family 1 profile domain-containing protein n=1 Tax=Pinctada imbricata TaxID=66713 RepID=A0AA88XE68_PINIB|nr:hypothetical protein FSP39_025352 [Pinctada imbricata]